MEFFFKASVGPLTWLAASIDINKRRDIKKCAFV